MSQKIRVAIAGLGGRGKDTYAPCAKLYADEMEIVAIADIIPEKVAEVAKEYGVAPQMCFSSAEEMLEQPKLADVMMICTQDRQHFGHALPALEKGYDLLLEKPISPDLKECKILAEAANRLGRRVVVCHVLRYTPFYQYIKQTIDSGALGDIVSIHAIENVKYWHQAHSFVRGNWRNSDLSSPMILQKSCHDMDILLWLAGKSCRRISSYGDLYYFKPEKAPAGAGMRCCECPADVKASCPYDAEKIYLTNDETGVLKGNTDWPANILDMNPTEENIRKAIEEGPYGRCVFHCDNNVVDHQVVTMQLEDGATIDFTMCAFNRGARQLKVMGTLGEIDADMDTNLVKITIFGQPTQEVDISTLAEDFSGHAGGDNRLVKDLLDLEMGKAGSALTSIDQSVESHFAALAAEYSRLHDGESVLMESFIKNVK